MKITVRFEISKDHYHEHEITISNHLYGLASNSLAPVLDYLSLKSQADSLFDAVKHGPEKHQKWLSKAIHNHFAGLPVEQENP